MAIFSSGVYGLPMLLLAFSFLARIWLVSELKATPRNNLLTT
jgi:hypothetical protein